MVQVCNKIYLYSVCFYAMKNESADYQSLSNRSNSRQSSKLQNTIKNLYFFVEYKMYVFA